jgi:hypothetical protein
LLRITRDNLKGSALLDIVRRELDEFALVILVSSRVRKHSPGSLSGIQVALYYVEGGCRAAGAF